MVRALFCSVLLFLSAPSCNVHLCTEIGCADKASFEIKTTDGTWPDGAYEITITANGVSYACSMSLPKDLPPYGEIGSLRCEPHLGYMDAALSADTVCTDANSANQTCTSTPGRYTLSGSLLGTPSTVEIRVTRDGNLLVEETLPLTYATTRPNGPDCEPVCHQASAELKVP